MNGVSNGHAGSRVFISDAPVVPTATVGVASGEDRTDGRSGQLGEPEESYCPGRMIKATFQDALRDDLQFDGDLTYHKVYDDAPNPCLKLDGPGAIGLPLNDIQIDAIKGFCIADPAAGENACFFPGEKIAIRNPKWTTWLNDVVVSHLNKALGASAKSCLIGLRIRGPQATGTAGVLRQRVMYAGQYANFSVVLPSPHTGGDICFDCGVTTHMCHTARHSEISTTVAGALSDSDLVLHPVDSGSVVSLEYILTCSPGANIPRLPHLQHAYECLYRAFSLWRQVLNADPAQLSHASTPARPEAAAPSVYFYVLKREYRTAVDLRRNLLGGSDQRLMTLMEPLARMFHFDVHLAHADYTRTGEAYAPTKRSRIAERFGKHPDASSLDSFDDDYDDESLDLDRLEMEDDVPSIKFGGVYTLDGEKVRISGSEIERITGRELEDEEQKKFVINGTLYDGDPSDMGWERWDSEPDVGAFAIVAGTNRC
ncbi:hypothetical protein AAF712_015911 [Marasmius tenuissimus]|uniref:Uncharacterized protein n=1 Tax=Marasmius tenuissimus TaxID=585030 RepID=A0ABR2Z793_9AGAR